MNIMKKIVWLSMIVALWLMSACGGKNDDAKMAKIDPEKIYQPTGNESSITGKVNFAGTAPAARRIFMEVDSFCNSKHPGGALADDFVAVDGRLQGVLIYVKDGLGDKAFEPPTSPAVLDQDGCLYKPHVLGVQVGQKFQVTTSDKTGHNVRTTAKANESINVNQDPNAGPIERIFTTPELIQVKCDQHSWMRAWVSVVNHPFFFVTGADGSFTLTGLPPGEYTIAAWHEKLGEKTIKITVGQKESKTVDFTFDASTFSTNGAAPSSLAFGQPLALSFKH